MTIDFKEALFVFEEEEEHKKTKFMYARAEVLARAFLSIRVPKPYPPNFLNFLFLWSNARIFKQKVKKTIYTLSRDFNNIVA